MGALLQSIAQGPTPVATYANQLAQGQEIQANTQNAQAEAKQRQLQNQQLQRDVQDSAITRQYLQKHNGDFKSLSQDQDWLSQVQPSTALGIQKSIIENSKAQADTLKLQSDAKDAQAKADKAHAELAGDTAYGLAKSGYSVPAFDAAMLDMENRGLMDPAHGEAIRQAVAQDPTKAKAIIDQLAINSPARIKDAEQASKDTTAAAAGTTAEARALTAKTDADKFAAGLPKITADNQEAQLKVAQTQKEQDADMLSQAAKQGPAALQAALGALPYTRAKFFEGITKPEDIVKAALTPDQAVTTGATQAQRDEQARHNAIEEQQGAQRVGIEGGRLAMEKQMSGFAPAGQVSPAAQMAADGRMDPATLRAQLRKNPGLIAQIQQVDPNFDEANIDNRYNTLKEFSNSGNTKAGGQVLALNTMIHHADLFLQTADALKNGSFRPGNAVYNAVASTFGSAPPTQTNLVAQFLAGEAGKVAKGGVPAEGEINGILKNMGSSLSPEQLQGAAQSLLQLAAGRMIPLKEKADQAKIGNVVQVLGPDAKAILQRRGFDPNTLAPVAQGGATAPNVTHRYNPATKKIEAVKPPGQ